MWHNRSTMIHHRFVFAKSVRSCYAEHWLAGLLCAWSLCHAAQTIGADEIKDFHGVRGRNPQIPLKQLFEGESAFRKTGNARSQNLAHFGPDWSGDHHLLWHGVVGDRLESEFRLRYGGRYQLSVQYTMAPDYGKVTVSLPGTPLKATTDLYAPQVQLAPLRNLGEVTLKPGAQKIVFQLSGANRRAEHFRKKYYLLGLDYLRLVKLDRPPSPAKASAAAVIENPPLLSFDQGRMLLKRYCFQCHGDRKAEGDINLEQLATEQHLRDNVQLADKIAHVLDRREMPPAKARQPLAVEREQLSTLAHAQIAAYLRSASVPPPVVMRRLNRYEYNNAVRDLLRLKGDIYPLPEKVIRASRPYFDPASGYFPDTIRLGNRTLGKFQVERQMLSGVVPFAIDLQSEHGFNNRGSELSLSPILLESLIQLGHSIVNSPQFAEYCQIFEQLFRVSEEQSHADQLQIGEQRIRTLLPRAFRRPVDAKTVKRYLQFFTREMDKTHSFTGSMKRVVAAILASPRFLYIVEQKHDLKSVTPLTDFELATRLSLFLWSSIPDETLLKLARQGRLHRHNVLRAQVERMLLDPRSQALSQNFARQWLRLDQLITAVPDFDRFSHYYSRIGCEQWKFGLQTMLEPLLLFESIMVEDRSVMLLLDSRYSYRSDELQSWYAPGRPFQNKGNIGRFNTGQQDFRRRQLSSRREGGVITTAATLTMTSSPLRTGPIARGAWVATVIFNRPPDPPPDVVPEIEADDAELEAKGVTLRQRLKQHQAQQSCAACHAKIDPLGFALENYDAVGRWRDRYRSGLQIDSSGKLFGEIEFTSIESFKDAILSRPEIFLRGFSEHLLSYALGRQLKIDDKPVVNHIVRRAIEDQGQFSSIVMAIATSHAFLHKTNQVDSPQSKSGASP